MRRFGGGGVDVAHVRRTDNWHLPRKTGRQAGQKKKYVPSYVRALTYQVHTKTYIVQSYTQRYRYIHSIKSSIHIRTLSHVWSRKHHQALTLFCSMYSRMSCHIQKKKHEKNTSQIPKTIPAKRWHRQVKISQHITCPFPFRPV